MTYNGLAGMPNATHSTRQHLALAGLNNVNEVHRQTPRRTCVPHHHKHTTRRVWRV